MFATNLLIRICFLQKYQRDPLGLYSQKSCECHLGADGTVMLILWRCPIKANVDILIVVFNILCFNGGAYHKNVWRHINIIFLMKSAIKQLFCKVCDVAMQV